MDFPDDASCEVANEIGRSSFTNAPVTPISVSTVTSRALWLNDRFMLGCAQHFTRVILAFGSAAADCRTENSVAPTPAASDLRSDLRSINADSRQHHRDRGETRGQDRVHPRPRENGRHVLLDGPDVRHRLRGVDVVNGATDRTCACNRIASGADNKIGDVAGCLRVQ
jgi:hypothetical protein